MMRKRMEICKSDSVLLNADVRYGKDAVGANHPFTSMKLYDNSHYLCICPKTTFITLLPILRNLSKKTNYFSTLNT